MKKDQQQSKNSKRRKTEFIKKNFSNKGSGISQKSLISDIEVKSAFLLDDLSSQKSLHMSKKNFNINSKNLKISEQNNCQINTTNTEMETKIKREKSSNFETRPRRNEFSKDTNWMASIQQINTRKKSQNSLREKIEKDVFNLLDNDESNNYDPSLEHHQYRVKHSTTSIRKEKLKQTFSTQPCTEKSFNYSKTEFFEQNFEKKIKDAFFEGSLFVESPNIEKAFDPNNVAKTFNFNKEELEDEERNLEDDRFNPFRAKEEGLDFNDEFGRFGKIGLDNKN